MKANVMFSVVLWMSLLKAVAAETLSEQGYKKLEMIMADYPAPYGYRDGNSTKTHSCGSIRAVPDNLRYDWVMKPSGIKTFYTKYTEAYGIPIISSKSVSDDALRRACYVVRFVLAEHSAIRQLYYKLFGRVAIIGVNEQVTDIPEYSHLDPDYWNARSRGLGATEGTPVSSGAEENILCFSSDKDRYYNEDIFVHEFTHGIHLLGAKYAIPGFQTDLETEYNTAKSNGMWKDTYSMSTVGEYLAEGVQSFFECNGYSATPDGIHGPINTADKLKTYDPDLYNEIGLLFPCGNTFIKRCGATRAAEADAQLKMDCDLTQEYQDKIPPYVPDACPDKNAYCAEWASSGECQTNPTYMNENCPKSCNKCSGGTTTETTTAASGCVDGNVYCSDWAANGECTANPGFMLETCKKSCNSC